MKENDFITGQIQELLFEIGIPANLMGFTYIVTALQIALLNREYIYRMTKILYAEVAKQYEASPASVERCIKYAITVGWTCGNAECIEQIFKHSINPARGVPTNSQFITRLYLFFTTQQTNEK